jgi:DNA-binding MarR family transcriptional regulator
MSETRLLRSVQRLANALSRLERQAAGASGVSVSQMRVLLSLDQSGEDGARISDLALEQGLAVSTMTRNLSLLERNGWVVRATGARDRRTVWIRLTASGRELAGTLSDSKVSRFSRAFSTFHPSDRVERAVALDRVAAALERADDEE